MRWSDWLNASGNVYVSSRVMPFAQFRFHRIVSARAHPTLVRYMSSYRPFNGIVYSVEIRERRVDVEKKKKEVKRERAK